MLLIASNVWDRNDEMMEERGLARASSYPTDRRDHGWGPTSGNVDKSSPEGFKDPGVRSQGDPCGTGSGGDRRDGGRATESREGAAGMDG